MVNGANLRVVTRQSVRNLPGPVPAPVVDDDDLIGVSHLRKDKLKGIHHSLNICFLIIGGEKGREALQLIHSSTLNNHLDQTLSYGSYRNWNKNKHDHP
jgi:hypothetical protein